MSNAAKLEKPKPPLWANIVAGVIVFGLIGTVASFMTGSDKERELGAHEAQAMCQETLRRAARDPDKADIPYVPNQGAGTVHVFEWGPATKVIRMRNGLGLDVAATASCSVSVPERRITRLVFNGVRAI